MLLFPLTPSKTMASDLPIIQQYKLFSPHAGVKKHCTAEVASADKRFAASGG
jgi:hypothetical protein